MHWRARRITLWLAGFRPSRLPYETFRVVQELRALWSALNARASAKWWGVQLGRSCKFYGVPRFLRKPGSGITIGNGCVFRSAEWAGTAGISRACLFATTVPGAVLSIGNKCGFSGTVISAKCGIRIGNNVLCGANTTILDSDRHAVDPVLRAQGDAGVSLAVTIEDDVWLGMNVTVLKGVTIGKGSVVGANSTVVGDIPPMSVAAGSPARVIGPVVQGNPSA